MKRKRSGYYEWDSITWRQVIQMNTIITWVLPLGIDVRKLLLTNAPMITDIFGAGRVLGIKPSPHSLQMSKLRPQLFNAKVWTRTRSCPMQKGRMPKSLQSSHLPQPWFCPRKTFPCAKQKRDREVHFTKVNAASEIKDGLSNRGGWCTRSLIPIHLWCLLECLKI